MQINQTRKGKSMDGGYHFLVDIKQASKLLPSKFRPLNESCQRTTFSRMYGIRGSPYIYEVAVRRGFGNNDDQKVRTSSIPESVSVGMNAVQTCSAEAD
jgi:hypothetical protein